MTRADSDLLAEYLETYLEWRMAYGVTDECMEELLAAILVESECRGISASVRDSLLALVRMIKAERCAMMSRAA